MMRYPCATVLVVALTACSGPSVGSGQASSQQVSLANTRFPALRFAPKEPTYAVASARTADMVTGVRELLNAIGLLADGDVAVIDRELTRKYGVNPLSVDSLTSIGIDAGKSAVVFSADIWPTAVVPVADEERLSAFLDKVRPRKGLQVRQFRGRDWYSHPLDDDVIVQWIRWEGHLAVRLTLDSEVTNVDWLADMFDDARTLAHSGTLQQVLQTVDASVESANVAGLFNPGDLLSRFAEIVPGDKGKALLGCARLLSPLSGAVAVGAHIDWGAARGSLSIGLQPDAAAALREHLLRPPPGYASVREQAGLYASMTVDPWWLDDHRAAIGCPLWKEPLVGANGTFRDLPTGFRGFVAALLDLQLSKRKARGVGYLGLREQSLARWLLDQIPQRRFLERKTEVAGQVVKVIAVPLLPRIMYRLDDTSLLMSVGSDVMTQTLSPPAEGAAADSGALDVASFGIYPQRLNDLQGILLRVAQAMQISSHFAKASYRRLSRYEYGKVELTLQGDALVLSLAMRLAQL